MSTYPSKEDWQFLPGTSFPSILNSSCCWAGTDTVQLEVSRPPFCSEIQPEKLLKLNTSECFLKNCKEIF